MNMQKGSAILFVIFMFSSLSIYITILMYSARLAHDYAYYRTKHIKGKYLFEGVKSYIIAWFLDNFETLEQQVKLASIIKKDLTFPFAIKEEAKVSIELMQRQQYFILKVCLLLKDASCFSSCYKCKKYISNDSAKKIYFTIEPAI